VSTPKRSPVESEEVLAVIPRGEHTELRIRRVKLVTGVELLDIRKWRKTWRGAVPDKGLAIGVDEAAAVAEALTRGVAK
jgi:hypothetical protein